MSNKEGLLSENWDFIEEAAPFSTEALEFQDIDELDISEGESTAPKWKLIGRVKGCMAPIGVYSRNHRIYENSHWIKVLNNKDLQDRIANRRLFGMPSHMQKNIDDEDFREGRISHIVSCLEVRNDKNGKPFLYGEFDILDTPAGRILKAMYEGGAGIYVSTRAAGKLEPIVGDPINKRVNSDSYYLGGIDCVLNPGFLQARPTFECAPANESVSEATINELDDKTIESDLDKRQDQTYDAAAHAKENPKEAKEAKEKYEKALNLAQKEAEKNDKIIDQDNKGHHVHLSVREEEIKGLQNQINQLAKILEKVVDDVYEQEEPKEETPEGAKEKEIEKKPEEAPQMQEQPIAPVQETEEGDKKKQLKKAVIPAFLKIVAESNISEEAFEEILDILKQRTSPFNASHN